MKSHVVSFLKWGLTPFIFTFLCGRAMASDSLRGFLGAQTDRHFFLLGLTVILGAVLLTLVRWKWLNNRLGIPQTTRGATRLGFIGYLFNFLPAGIVGGDLVEDVLLAYRNPGAKIVCAVSMIGPCILVLVGLVAPIAIGLWCNEQSEARLAFQTILWLTVAPTLLRTFVLASDSRQDCYCRFFRRIPGIGFFLVRLYDVGARCRSRIPILTCRCVAAFAVHGFLAAGFWFTALVLSGRAPAGGDHVVICPVAKTDSRTALSAGPMEFFLDQLYPPLSCAVREPYPSGDGLWGGVAYRFPDPVIAAIGGVHFLVSRWGIYDALGENRRRQAEGKTE
ncbi:MAG: hypothetical protein ACOX6D_04875 [Thermoguttaceae bacterium]|jgi:hypothetical protein